MTFFNHKNKLPFDYYKVRNIAWEFLIKNNVKEYPLDLKAIIFKNKWNLISYAEYSKTKKISIEKVKQKYGNLGFHFIFKNDYFIVINEENSEHIQRFTIAHEIGHIVLHKIIPNKIKLESEANMFAARILMPMFLIKELNITTKQELSRICNVSETSAEYRLERYNKIKDRNKFYTNPLEKQVYENLKPFIENYKKFK